LRDRRIERVQPAGIGAEGREDQPPPVGEKTASAHAATADGQCRHGMEMARDLAVGRAEMRLVAEGERAFADLFGDVAAYLRYRDAADRLRKAADTHLYSSELGRFVRRIAVEEDGTQTVDMVLDSAIYGLWRFGMYPPDDARITETMSAIRDQLSNKAPAGGIARYQDDYYFKVEPDTKKVPGNPWFMCSLWLAQWYIAIATGACAKIVSSPIDLGGAPGTDDYFSLINTLLDRVLAVKG